MFYVIATTYEGPNADQHLNDDEVIVATEPALGNCSHEPVIEGWAGTTNDWCVVAHGAFENEDAAIAKAQEVAGGEDSREIECYNEDGVIIKFGFGKYEVLCAETRGLYVGNSDITWETTDEELEEIARECEATANMNGDTLGDSFLDECKEYRNDELEAHEEEEED